MCGAMSFYERLDGDYVDGLFDGEGCVYWDGRAVRVSITNTCLPIIKALQYTYGGGVRLSGPKVWRWEASGAEAYDFLTAREGCLIKYDQVQVAMTIMDTVWIDLREKRKLISKLKKLKTVRWAKK